MKRHLAAAGWQVEFDEREVLLSYPRTLDFALYAGAVGAAIVQRRDRFDADAIPPGDVPKYNAWSASGDVRARVVDAGWGTRADFERLRELGERRDVERRRACGKRACTMPDLALGLTLFP